GRRGELEYEIEEEVGLDSRSPCPGSPRVPSPKVYPHLLPTTPLQNCDLSLPGSNPRIPNHSHIPTH
ncbi:hypothetical protein SK128_005880, partial [Halocaridina rubra]